MTTPLVWNLFNAEILKEGVRRGLPILAQTEPIAGTTAPLSFSGGLSMGNCENLFLVTLAQLLKPGASIAYSVGNALTDLGTGHAIFYPADKMLWKIASTKMARFYRLPSEGEATGSMVGRYDTQNGIEHALHMLPAVILRWGNVQRSGLLLQRMWNVGRDGRDPFGFGPFDRTNTNGNRGHR